MFIPPKTDVILMADDDEEDQMLAREALEENRIVNPIYFVNDGEELMDYLYRQGNYRDSNSSPRPGLILLDLNMPRKNGQEALREIKSNPYLRQIPVIIMTTSQSNIDIFQSYDLGANSYISKPATFEGLVEAMRIVCEYWFNIVEQSEENLSLGQVP